MSDPSRRRVLFGINGGIALAHVGNYLYFPILVATLGASYSGFWAGFVMFMTYVGRLTATFCYAGAASRLGTRASVVAGVLIEAVPLGLMGLTRGVGAYAVLAFFIGFGSGISFPGLKNILSSFPAEARPKAFASFQMACQLGALGGALLGGLFLGVSATLLFTTVFALFLAYCLAAFALLPAEVGERPARAPLFDTRVVTGLNLHGGGRYFVLSSVFWVLSISFLVGIPLHMETYVRDWPTSVPFWITGLALIVLQFPAFRFMIRHFAPGQVMAAAFGAMTVAYVLFGAGRTAPFLVAGCLVVVFGDILFTPSFDLWVSARMAPQDLAQAMGAMHFFRSFGNMIGSIVAGALFDLSRSTGVPGLNWYLTAAVAVGCAVVSLTSRADRAAPAAAVEDLPDEVDVAHTPVEEQAA